MTDQSAASSRRAIRLAPSPVGGLFAAFDCGREPYATGCKGVNSTRLNKLPLAAGPVALYLRGKSVRGLIMQLATYHHITSAVGADALFVSVLQGSDKPEASQVRKAIAAAVRAYGGRGCAQRVAQEFGDHPETAVARMRWARAVTSEVFASPPGLAQSSARRRPEQPVADTRARQLVGI